jgi:DNA polymerase III epsilon subunit-like protein
MASLFKKFGVLGIAILDFETTGLNPEKDFPTEVAIKKVGISKLTAQPYIKDYSTKIKLPEGVEVPEFITNLTGLTTEDLNTNGKDITEVIPEVQNLIDSETLVIAHNANFDLGFLYHHMGIQPLHFMCTRTISILTDPDKNASLKNVYARLFGEKEQTHRAGDDVEMTLDVFNAFIGEHGNDCMMFFKNKLVNMPDRELVYTPYNAIILDFTEKYVSSKTYNELKERVEYLEERDDELSRLEAYGVDNWCGYDEAMSDSMGIFE